MDHRDKFLTAMRQHGLVLSAGNLEDLVTAFSDFERAIWTAARGEEGTKAVWVIEGDTGPLGAFIDREDVPASLLEGERLVRYVPVC